nr:uncharacterized protein LOC133612115 [Nerophis lumbriciformis]
MSFQHGAVWKNHPEAATEIHQLGLQTGEGRKWNATQTVDQAIVRLKHQEMVGQIQSGRAGFGWVTASKMWSKASRKERKDLVISEVVKMEEESYMIKAVGQQQQGRWTIWEAVVNRVVTWADMWKMPQARLSFLIRATYDTLPSPRNLHVWYGAEVTCQLCDSQNPSLHHILSGCKVALSQGRYGWRHDRVLRKLAEILEARRVEANGASPGTAQRLIKFVKQGGQPQSSSKSIQSLLSVGGEWNMKADLDRQLKFPQEITTTLLRPDIVLWSTSTKTVIMVELTVPWEEGMEAAFERKRDEYLELASECAQAGWRPFTYPVEVGCRGYTGASTQRLLKSLGIKGSNLKKALKALGEEAEQGSFWLWLRRNDKAWGKQGA